MLRGTPVVIISALAGSVSAIADELTASDALLRSPLALSRRVGFVQLHGGSGASATAGYLASMLAHRRTGMVLGVNASAGEANMLWHAGLTRSTGAGGDDQERRRHPRPAATQGRTACPGDGLIALDLARDHLAASAGTWFEQVTPIARFYDLVITDWGVRHQQVDLRQVARAQPCRVLGCPGRPVPGRGGSRSAACALGVEDRPGVVLALVDVGRTAEGTPQLLRDQLQVPS